MERSGESACLTHTPTVFKPWRCQRSSEAREGSRQGQGAQDADSATRLAGMLELFLRCRPLGRPSITWSVLQGLRLLATPLPLPVPAHTDPFLASFLGSKLLPLSSAILYSQGFPFGGDSTVVPEFCRKSICDVCLEAGSNVAQAAVGGACPSVSHAGIISVPPTPGEFSERSCTAPAP